MVNKLIFVSSILHLTTYISVGLASVYQAKWLGFIGLVSLTVALLINSTIQHDVETAHDEPTDYDKPDPYLVSLGKKAREKTTKFINKRVSN